MAPLTCQILDGEGRGVRGVQVTLHCESAMLRDFLKFESLTDEDGGISMWFSCGIGSRVTQMQPRLLDTSLLRGATLTLVTHPSNRSSGPQNMIRANLHLLSDELPAVTVHLGQAPRVEYMDQAVASPVNEWYQNYDQPTENQAVSPLLLPSPLVRPHPAAGPLTSQKRKRDSGSEEGAAKRTKVAF